MHLRLIPIGFALSVCLACTTEPSSGEESETSSESGESGTAEEIMCTEPCEVVCAESLPALSCQPDLLCGVIDYEFCSGPAEAEAIQCMVDALIAQTPGQLQLEYIQQDYADQFWLVILEDGTLVERHHTFNAGSSNRNDYRVGPLQDPAYFENCNAESDPCDKFDCIREWMNEDSCEGLSLPDECR